MRIYHISVASLDTDGRYRNLFRTQEVSLSKAEAMELFDTLVERFPSPQYTVELFSTEATYTIDAFNSPEKSWRY